MCSKCDTFVSVGGVISCISPWSAWIILTDFVRIVLKELLAFTGDAFFHQA